MTVTARALVSAFHEISHVDIFERVAVFFVDIHSRLAETTDRGVNDNERQLKNVANSDGERVPAPAYYQPFDGGVATVDSIRSNLTRAPMRKLKST